MGAWEKRRAVERLEWEPLIRSGVTVRELCEQRGVSHQRIRQKLDALGLADLYRSIQGGGKKEKKASKQAEREAACIARWGCGLAVKREINRARAGLAYSRQRQNARMRDIEWDLTLGEWWEIWQASGQWKNRGVLAGQYCMSRFGDSGAYRVGNVAVVANAVNFAEARSHAKKSSSTGVYRTLPNATKPWIAYAGRKYLGYFLTEQDASNARARHLEILRQQSCNL